jgi:hypothetical protein
MTDGGGDARAPKGDSCCLLEGDAGDFELEGLGAAVGDHEADLGHGFGVVIREVEAVAAADGNHGAQGDFDFLPIAAGGEFGEVVMAGLRVGLDDEAIVFAVTFETEDGVLILGDVDGIEVVLDGGKAAVVFEGDFAAEDEMAGFVVDYVSAGYSAHDAIIFDLPSAHGSGVGEVEEDFGGFRGFSVQRDEAKGADECQGEGLCHGRFKVSHRGHRGRRGGKVFCFLRRFYFARRLWRRSCVRQVLQKGMEVLGEVGTLVGSRTGCGA